MCEQNHAPLLDLRAVSLFNDASFQGRSGTSALNGRIKWRNIPKYGRIAQSVEQRIENPRVPGSIPGPATIFFFYQHRHL